MGFEEPRESGRPQLSGLKTSGRASGDRPDLARSSKGSKTPPQSPFNRSLGFRTEPFFIGCAVLGRARDCLAQGLQLM